MIHRIWTAALAVVLAGCAEPSAFEKMSLLERDIRLSANRESPGLKISVWLAQADGRELLAIDADRPIPGASTLKILILVEAHAQALSGTFKWTDEHTLLRGDMVEGGSFQHEKIGSSWTFLQYARRMITESDNTAANVLLRRLGMRNVNERATKLGLQVTQFEREFMDFDARDNRRLDNWTTAREMGQLVRAIFRREILTPDACDEMIELLERTGRRRIAAGVPKDIAVGHKSGVAPGGLRHDVGWVRVPGRPYILSVFLENVLPDTPEGDRGIAAIEAIAWRVYDKIGPTDE